MNRAHFGPIVDDGPVIGACRPGHLGGDLADWTGVLADGGVSEVVCLLSAGEAGRWGLPGAYDHAFRTHHVPVRDRHLPSAERLGRAVDTLGRRRRRGVASRSTATRGWAGRGSPPRRGWSASAGTRPPRPSRREPMPRAPREVSTRGQRDRGGTARPAGVGVATSGAPRARLPGGAGRSPAPLVTVQWRPLLFDDGPDPFSRHCSVTTSTRSESHATASATAAGSVPLTRRRLCPSVAG